MQLRWSHFNLKSVFYHVTLAFLLDVSLAFEDSGFARKLRFLTFSLLFWQNYWVFIKFCPVFLTNCVNLCKKPRKFCRIFEFLGKKMLEFHFFVIEFYLFSPWVFKPTSKKSLTLPHFTLLGKWSAIICTWLASSLINDVHGYPSSTGLQFHLTFTLVGFPVASTDVGGGVGLGAVAVA